MSKYIDDTVHALADPSRRAAVELLAAGPKRAGQLAQALGASAPGGMCNNARHTRS